MASLLATPPPPGTGIITNITTASEAQAPLATPLTLPPPRPALQTPTDVAQQDTTDLMHWQVHSHLHLLRDFKTLTGVL